MEIINVEEARKILAESKTRQDAIIEELNANIIAFSKQGINWMHVQQLNNLTEHEKKWLLEEVVLKGHYTIKNGSTISW